MVHFAMQSGTFTHAFQSTTFTMREFEEGSQCLDTYLQALAAKLNSNEDFTPDDTFTVDTTFVLTQVLAAAMANNTDPAKLPCAISSKHHVSPSRARTTCVALVPSSPGYPGSRLRKSQGWIPGPGTKGQETPPFSGRSRRSLWTPNCPNFKRRCQGTK